jgi:hypothetical protein
MWLVFALISFFTALSLFFYNRFAVVRREHIAQT